MVLLVLAGIWAAVLIPPAVRARAEGRPGDSIHNFKRQLTVLRRTGPHAAFQSPALSVVSVSAPRNSSVRSGDRRSSRASSVGRTSSSDSASGTIVDSRQDSELDNKNASRTARFTLFRWTALPIRRPAKGLRRPTCSASPASASR